MWRFWLGRASLLGGAQVLTNQVAFATCRSQCWKAPPSTAFNMVVNSPLCCSIFPEDAWRNTVHTINPVLSGPEVYEAVVQLNSFWSAMLPQDFLFKAQMVFWAVLWGLQPSSGALHHCRHVTLALVGLQECDVSDWQASPYLYFDHHPPHHRGFTHLALLDCSTCFTVMDNLGDGVHG